MADEMTPGEIARSLARIEAGQADLRRELGERLDRTVPLEVYQVQHRALTEEIAELKAEISAERKDRAEELSALREDIAESRRQRVLDRRWWMTAVAIPSAGLVGNYLSPLLGGGGGG